MSRVWPLGLVVLLAASALGCTACGTPFDYCSATYNPHLDPCGGCDDCRENIRLGSIFSDDSIAPLSYTEPAEQPAPTERQPAAAAEELPEPGPSVLPELEPPGSEPAPDQELMPLEEPTTEPLEAAPAEEPAAEPAAEPSSEQPPAEEPGEPPTVDEPPAAEEPAAEQPTPAPPRTGWRPSRSPRR